MAAEAESPPTRLSRSLRAALLLRLEAPPDSELTALQPHPSDGALLLGGLLTGTLCLYATSSGDLVQRLEDPGKPSAVTSVAWADELAGAEHVVAGHRSGTLRIWRLDASRLVASLPAHRSDVTALAVFPALGRLATGSADGSIKVWALGGGVDEADAGGGRQPLAVQREPLRKLRGHGGELSQLAFSPDGELLLSGDSRGGLRVWDVGSGRLLADLSTHHGGAITGLACHPSERIFASCSADRTVRVWDADELPAACPCIGAHGHEGRREVRALAWAAGGRALLAAYPDALRTLTLDPLACQDAADVAWSKVHAVRYTDGKAIGISLLKGGASLHCLDLTRLRPFTAWRAAAARQASGHAEPSPGPGAELCATSQFVAAAPAAAAVPQHGAAASFVAQQRQVLEARGAAVNAGPAVHAPPRRHASPDPIFTGAAPSGRSGTAASAGAPACPLPARSSRSSEAQAAARPPRLSAEENGAPGGQPGGPASCPGRQEEPVSMLSVTSHRGFLQEAQQRSRQHCAQLRNSRALTCEVKQALRRGDLQGAVRLLKEGQDLSVTAAVFASRALQRGHPDRFTPELCAAASPLLHALLSPPAAPLHRQAALQLLAAVLERWGDYVRGCLSPAPRLGKVDLAYEQRQERSRGLRTALQGLVPPLERLAGSLGGGRAAQLLARVREL